MHIHVKPLYQHHVSNVMHHIGRPSYPGGKVNLQVRLSAQQQWDDSAVLRMTYQVDMIDKRQRSQNIFPASHPRHVHLYPGSLS